MSQQSPVQVAILGAGLTGLTLAFYLKKAGLSVCIIDKAPQPGGVIHTLTSDGFTFETGPNTGVIGSPEIVQLFDDLQGKCTLELANNKANKRLIWKKDDWCALPSGLVSAVKTPLFSWYDKFRILGEPFRKPGTNPDETLSQLVIRRLGRSFLDYAVDPFIAGVYAGDPNRLIPRYALPKLYHLEQRYGSFIKGTIKKAREPKSELEKRVSRKVFSVEGGLQNLVNALTEAVGTDCFYLGSNQTQVAPNEKGFRIEFTDAVGQAHTIYSDKVVSTVGAHALPSIFPFIKADDMSVISSLTYARVIQTVVGYKHWEGRPIDAFGGLIPSIEKRNILGILFPSTLFVNRAPEGGALLSVFLGGLKNDAIFDKTDREICDLVIDEVQKTLHTSSKPDLLQLFRYPYAIPQYELSTGERLAAMERVQLQYPGLYIAGNSCNGIGMSDRVKQARNLADKLIEGL